MNSGKKFEETDDLERRVKHLEEEHSKWVNHLAELAKLESFAEAKERAWFEALMTVVVDLARHEGISQSEVLTYVKTVYQHCLDRDLRKLSDTLPHHAGDIDTRTIGEIESIPDIRPLFPD